MRFFDLVSKMFNEVVPRPGCKMDSITIWEVIRQGSFYKDDLNRYKFYDAMYNKLFEGKIKNAEDVAQLSYKIRKENGEL